jgi:hypothetical protein
MSCELDEMASPTDHPKGPPLQGEKDDSVMQSSRNATVCQWFRCVRATVSMGDDKSMHFCYTQRRVSKSAIAETHNASLSRSSHVVSETQKPANHGLFLPYRSKNAPLQKRYSFPKVYMNCYTFQNVRTFHAIQLFLAHRNFSVDIS